ncbi:acetylxylan esterase [Sphingobacterium pedocola]|uniref:Acetylxylan esterase n=1 Tax=Sphingobacterium pedocola TaxID=2082722 RepID=A0ABR9TBE9_9SPHI|nr:acetylxylan esterase [Sphingobacterium pedocola]MBE8722651.1 acetylxylan esterase [Sphingobacterium pedocola]
MNKSCFLRNLFAVLFLCIFIFSGFAQSRNNQLIQVLVSPDKSDWTYALGEKASFEVRVIRNQVPMTDVEISYSIGPEKMKPLQTGKSLLKSKVSTVGSAADLKKPGFLRCEVSVEVDGRSYRGIATAAFAPEAISPTQVLPDDFMAFWSREKEKAQQLPLDAKMVLLPERGTETVDVYQVSFQNYQTGSRMYGILSRPKKAGQYPAVLHVPGAGIRPYDGSTQLAEKGIIALQLGIHGIPVTYPAELYNTLASGALKDYPFFNLDNRDQYYYKRVYLGCVRAVDFLTSLADFDGENMLVAGGSQGGALSIVTAALDKRVKGLVSNYPALCDLTGYVHGRAGGWPHMFNTADVSDAATAQKIKVSAYYDVVNFARYVTVPGFYTWGYNDEVCPPTSYYAAYNLINAPKELYLLQETGHWTHAEQNLKVTDWLLERLNKK